MQQFKPEENSSKIINLYRSNTKLLKVLKSTTLTTQRGRGRAITKKTQASQFTNPISSWQRNQETRNEKKIQKIWGKAYK